MESLKNPGKTQDLKKKKKIELNKTGVGRGGSIDNWTPPPQWEDKVWLVCGCVLGGTQSGGVKLRQWSLHSFTQLSAITSPQSQSRPPPPQSLTPIMLAGTGDCSNGAKSVGGSVGRPLQALQAEREPPLPPLLNQAVKEQTEDTGDYTHC